MIYRVFYVQVTNVGGTPIGDLTGGVPQWIVTETLGRANVNVDFGGVQVGSGTITDLRIVGEMLFAVVEAGGRACPVCGNTYDEDDATERLVPASSFPDKVRALRPKSFARLSPWASICLDWSDCERRVLEAEKTSDLKASTAP